MNDFKKQDKSKKIETHLNTKDFTPFQRKLLNGSLIDKAQAAEFEKIVNKSRKWKV